MNVEKIRKYLQVIERAKQLIEQEINDVQGTPEALMQTIMEEPVIKKTIQQTVIKEVEVAQPIAQPIAQPVVDKPDEAWIAARKKHVSDLMAIDCWPEAVKNHLIANSNKENQINRANSVLDATLDRPIENLSVLDFGCGDGWIARQAALRGATSVVGYDIVKSDNWNTIQKVKFTDDINELKEESFDVIILYDVLDHCKDPVGVMQKVKSLLRFGQSIVYVRCHPWTSRHATHVYKQGLNKAYVHLFLTQDEIREQINGEEPLFTRPEKTPLQAYHWWFNDLKIIKERVIKDEPLSSFFLVPSFKELIINEQQLKPNEVEGFFNDMQIQFIDFNLTL